MLKRTNFGALPNKTKKKERHLRAALNVGALYMVIVLCHQVWEVRSRVYFFLFFIRKKKKNWKTWQANDDNDEKGDFFKMRFGSCRCIFFDFLEGLYEFPSNWDKHQTMESKSWACWYGETTYCVVSLYNLTQIDSRVLCGYDVDNMSNTHYRHVESRGKIQFKD